MSICHSYFQKKSQCLYPINQGRAEVMAMSIYVYNEAEHMKMEREYAYADGHKAGIASGSRYGQNCILNLIQKMT